MSALRIVPFCFLIIISCNCQHRATKSVGENNNENNSDYIAALLQEKNFTILINTTSIVEYEIRPNLIVGTVDEYSNKLFLKDTLNQSLVVDFIDHLNNDTSYDWNVVPENITFDPKTQYQLHSDFGKLTLLIDEHYRYMRFINLEGQKIVLLSQELSQYLKNL
ncbi:hypothetical protein Q2T41_10380 [Maribacter confluentis]|uniref:Lipoprotein n=1 Tax=Maribacter confluentis TaxID=1656093 RepID=A0ABT8RRM1_9FLAO|nr:hypothetical protein [Maribacter confluentis]MDO1513062.1 hypothetical protein [Maribacter confluentis]